MKDLMKRHLYLIAPIVFAAVISLVAPVSATAGDPDITLGLGVALVPDYEGSDHYEALPLPFANVAWDCGRFLKLDGNTLRANVVANDTWSFGPLVQYRDKRSDVDNGQVDDMRKVDPASEVGAFVGMNVDNWKAELFGVKDIAAAHHGYLVSLSGGYTMPVDESLKIYMGASTTFASGANTIEIQATSEGQTPLVVVQISFTNVASGAPVQISQALKTNEIARFIVNAP